MGSHSAIRFWSHCPIHADRLRPFNDIALQPYRAYALCCRKFGDLFSRAHNASQAPLQRSTMNGSNYNRGYQHNVPVCDLEVLKLLATGAPKFRDCAWARVVPHHKCTVQHTTSQPISIKVPKTSQPDNWAHMFRHASNSVSHDERDDPCFEVLTCCCSRRSAKLRRSCKSVVCCVLQRCCADHSSRYGQSLPTKA